MMDRETYEECRGVIEEAFNTVDATYTEQVVTDALDNVLARAGIEVEPGPVLPGVSGHYYIYDRGISPWPAEWSPSLVTELADKAVALLAGIYKAKEVKDCIYPDGFYDMIETLDKAGVKHAWYTI